MTACGESTPKLSAEQVLHANFLNAYKPLESCLNDRLGGIATNKAASAIVKANKLDELNQEAVRLLPSDNPELLIALKQSDAEKKAFALLGALVGYRDVKIQHKAVIDSYGLLREVAAANVLSNINQVNCPQPEYLEYWLRESERMQIYLDSQVEASELSKCTYGATGKPNSDWPAIIVEANKLQELEMLAVRILGKDDQQLISVMAVADPLIKANNLIYLLAQYSAADRLPNQSYEMSIRGILGMNGIKLIYAQAKNLDCALPNPSWSDIAEIYLTEHPLSANPSPFTNNKVDTP